MLPSGLPEVVAEDEQIAAFLTSSSSHFNSTMVKAAAYLPNQKDGEKSVCRHGAEPRAELQRLSSDFFAGAPETKVYGAGVVAVSVVRAAGLRIESDEPPERHATVRGWAWSETDPKMGKAENIERAKRLAEKATLVRW